MFALQFFWQKLHKYNEKKKFKKNNKKTKNKMRLNFNLHWLSVWTANNNNNQCQKKIWIFQIFNQHWLCPMTCRNLKYKYLKGALYGASVQNSIFVHWIVEKGPMNWNWKKIQQNHSINSRFTCIRTLEQQVVWLQMQIDWAHWIPLNGLILKLKAIVSANIKYTIKTILMENLVNPTKSFKYVQYMQRV